MEDLTLVVLVVLTMLSCGWMIWSLCAGKLIEPLDFLKTTGALLVLAFLMVLFGDTLSVMSDKGQQRAGKVL
jgi:hypothetical protein